VRPLPVDTVERSCGRDVIETKPDWSTHKAWPNGSCTNPQQSRLSRGRGEDGLDWTMSVDRSSQARSAESLPPAGRPSRAPRASHSPHTRRRRLPIRDAQGEVKSLHSSPRKPTHGRVGHWFRRPPQREMQGQAMTPEARGVVSLSLSRRGNALALQIEQRVRQVNATLAEQD
jgi:hypothetical protein